MCCYRECLVLSKEQMEKVENTIVNALNLNTEEHDRDIPGCKEVSTFRRQTAYSAAVCLLNVDTSLQPGISLSCFSVLSLSASTIMFPTFSI